ncbi:MAG: transglutaminase family protein [Coriobacteriia bacterium]|nr:transglutaminase family protein [Coriobacteriia bacterium]
MDKKRRYFVGISVSVVFLIVASMLFLILNAQKRSFDITETYRISMPNKETAYLQVALPITYAYQELGDFNIEGVDSYEIVEYDGWCEMIAIVNASKTSTEALVRVQYSLSLLKNIAPWDGEVLDEYLQHQQYVDIENTKIIELARQLQGADDYQTALNTVEYVHKTLKIPKDTQPNKPQLSASELLDDPSGVCYDFAILTTALLRANAIPTRLISGLTLQLPLQKASDWMHPGIAHAWVEFFANDKWHIADPTWGRFDKSDTAHLSYGTYESNIFSDFQQLRYQEIESAGYHIVGGMSAPLAFMVYSTGPDVTVIPKAVANVNWF